MKVLLFQGNKTFVAEIASTTEPGARLTDIYEVLTVIGNDGEGRIQLRVVSLLVGEGPRASFLNDNQGFVELSSKSPYYAEHTRVVSGIQGIGGDGGARSRRG